ncbi:hypothetical protein TUM20985_50380 [Mycobacterium antarcticum]|uniref:hypothetical protein n=1 Tax=unclassified Mycolicibacterium TaxID=2636767 RepID=UPI0023878789|nr:MULTISPECIES: hypothetical protein [unclassified Mycolicibacterium]BDX34491.1 hypothetical protein TUM20985_50380 [Mycolicibacterium sp. TUM20985]GLP77695.1 hypothetical protein TUM20983_48050 [Mycolicibacterium sp. TUM20983]GLP81905.1 hypothetical protein TUM20984_33250 [Mycolicibacterium sp. TUM20984]
MPAESRARGGVLLCASIGKDAADSIVAQRLIADALARDGIAVLRFDYLGCGDSSFGDTRPEAVAEWQTSIEHAASYLRTAMDTDDLSIVAMRAGCLITAAASRDHPAMRSVKRVAYLDPVGTGRRFLREQTMFFKMAGGDAESAEPGSVSIIGAELSAKAARDFSALKLSGDGEWPRQPEMFVVGRADGADVAVTAMAEGVQPNVFLSDGLASAAQPTRLLAPTPTDAIDAVVDWLVTRVPSEPRPFHPVVTDRARIADGAGGFVVERIESVGPDRLFAIRTMPDRHDASVPLPTVVFFTNAVNAHWGPSRGWVHIARATARDGRQAFRWDRRGAGESGPARRNSEVYIYSQEGIDDAIAATRHARESASKLVLVGLCSGAWYAAHGARAVGAEALSLVNVLLWSWRVKSALREPIAPADHDVADWEQSRRARLRRLVSAHLPAAAWRMLGRTGVVQAPENLLATFARQGTSVTAILCPDDAKLFFANRGGEALHRLGRTKAPPRVIETGSGDHAGFDPIVLQPIARSVAEALG